MITEKCCKHPDHLKMCNIDDFPVINGKRSSWCSSCRKQHIPEIDLKKTIKKKCPACVTPHRSHFLFLDHGITEGICPICGISFEVVERNDRNRHIGGIDLVLVSV